MDAVSSKLTVREATRCVVTRDVLFPGLAIAAIVISADVRVPMGLPGHRGLIWLTLLVTTVLITRRRETVVVVGAASMLATLGLHISPDAWGSGRYLAAAILLYAVAAAPVAVRRRWVVALAAAPIHLVALAGALATWLSHGYLPVLASVGMAEKTLCHLLFGLLAGLLGWTVASIVNRFHWRECLS
ncbi:MAG: hypothetical protein WA317_01010 [Mycobacterium sp.]|uniref:hypothetical protein n=1 Tax=Mycobacterium sp. TaxID=1785 RepID=UPI003CC5E948